jgi:hypothetical protein
MGKRRGGQVPVEGNKGEIMERDRTRNRISEGIGGNENE